MDDASSTTLSAGEDSPAPVSNPNSLGARNVAHVAHGYGNLDALERTPPLVITRGKGVSIIDEEGRDYIEGVAGMWCANFGFSESALVDAAIEQFRVLPYYHSLIDKTTEPMGRLAERLKASTHVPMARVFFANSGSEANDTLVKLTWYYHNAIGKPEKKKIISRFMGFHGVTCGAASVTGHPADAHGLRPAGQQPLPQDRLPALLPLRRAGRERGGTTPRGSPTIWKS